jgi:hypothetical protein
MGLSRGFHKSTDTINGQNGDSNQEVNNKHGDEPAVLPDAHVIPL